MKIPMVIKVITIAIIYCLGYGYTRAHFAQAYWCDNNSATYKYQECRDSVNSDAKFYALFWPIYGVSRLGAYFAPNPDIYRKGDFEVGPKPDELEKNKCELQDPVENETESTEEKKEKVK